jgi:hypothetical protein
MRQVFGGLLFGLGILIGGLSGLCSVFLLGAAIFDPATGPNNYLSVPVVLIVGGIPFVFGLGLFFAGRSLLRDRAGVGSVPPKMAQSERKGEEQ